MAIDPNSVDYLNRQIKAMDKERSSFISHYRDLSEYIQPRKGRFSTSDRNRGDRRYNKIINSVGTMSLRTATAGLLSGVVSPSRPWHSTETADRDLMEYGPVKIWLNELDNRIRDVLNRSNFYNMTPVKLSELLLFGTGVMSHVDDFERLARFYTHTAGSYMIGQNDKYEIDRFAREFEATVAQLIQWFGESQVSTAVKQSYDRGDYHLWYKVNQLIEPNPNFEEGNPFQKKFRSVYWEPNGESKKLLSEKGFDDFPVYVTRWSVTGEDIYGTDCPGMTALGDIRMLQVEEKRKAQAIDKMVNPPMHGPASIRNVPVQALAGGLTVYDGQNNQKLEPIYQVDPRLQELRADMQAVESRIEKAFYVDLFLAISNMDGVQPRNQLELTQRNQERLLQLGPVLERFHSEFLDPLISRIFKQMVERDLLPPPPPELEGQELKIRYVSSLAQAQRSVATGPIERVAGFITNMAQFKPEILDKFNSDQAVDEYAQLTGAIPTIIVPDEEVAIIRQQRAQIQAQQAQMEQEQQAAQTDKLDSETQRNLNE